MTEIYHQLKEWVSHKGEALICGTGPSLDCLEDRSLVEALCARFNIFCVNTSHHYFNDIDIQFIGGRYLLQVQKEFFRNKRVKFLIGESNQAHLPYPYIKTTTLLSFDDYEPSISTDITVPLPHGPTTILDIVIPTCIFCGIKWIYLLGTEYPRSNYRRFAKDRRPGELVDGKLVFTNPDLHNEEMNWAHRKWETWKEYFKIMGVSVIDLSGGELDLPKLNIRDLV